ncbi:hypothetical protein ENKNEFLB_02831 [Nocardioides aquaticus]|uniref:Uncharacterized protein n=1 Tax=Nocardioides aquaticus TaxID=160826 RepID=A0ABX8EIX7_9ACTN|nr:hypothetical protein [Nocardioides aquaticus]QVT80436.1 hypothetical protein ENKNEFLB_02831 [Nocardioides aquaticus]
MTALGTRLLTLTIGGEEYAAQVSNCRITTGEADSDFVSFAQAAAGGGREYKLAFTAVQDPDADTIWDLVWTQAGSTVAAVIKPNGGTVAGPATPHFTGNVVITEPDGDILGGEANASSTAKFTFEAEWTYTAKPVRVIA